MFEDMLDDPEHAATLFEMVEPSLPQPTAVMREFTPVSRIPRWTLRTDVGAFRLKIAGDATAAVALARGAGVLAALRSGALRAGALRSGLEAATVKVPTPRRLELHLHETELSVAIEERLGGGDARTAWPRLSTAQRCAIAEASAEQLVALHAVLVDDVPALRCRGGSWGAAPRGSGAVAPARGGCENASNRETPSGWVGIGPVGASSPHEEAPEAAPGPEGGDLPWREVVYGRIERRVAALRDGDILEGDLLARVERRLRNAAASLPLELERRLCHGAFGLESVALDRQAVVGIQDFEVASPGDPWADVAYWLASSGDPDGRAARRFFDTYRDHVTVPPDLPARIDLYAGLTVLRAMAYLGPNFTDEGCATIAEVTESWVSTAPRPWI